MMRRTTLGEVTNTRLPRASMAPMNKRPAAAVAPRMSLQVGKPAGRALAPVARGGGGGGALARHSLAGAGVGRKNSVGARRGSNYGAGATGIKTDPRPLTDKTFKNESTRALLNYLEDYGYDQPISVKLLTRPSGRDFNNIMGFLFRQYDPRWQPSPGARFEDEVIPFLKSIGYPYSLPKSCLQAVGAPQTWPKALGAISWLVELLMYDKEVGAHEAEQQDRRAVGNADGISDHALDDKVFFDYLGHAYKCFLDCDESGQAALEEDLQAAFTHQQEQIEKEVAALQVHNASLRASTEAVLSRAGALPELRERQRALASDLEKFRILIGQLEGHRTAVEEKVGSRTKEEEWAKAELAGLREHNAALRERIANQELSAEDVQRMSLERQRLKDGMLKAAEDKGRAQKRKWEAEMALSRKLEALDNAVHEYNSKAQALQLVPVTAKNANGQDFELSINRHNLEDEDNVLTNDLRGHIRPALTRMRDGIMQRTQDERQKLLEVLDAQESSEEKLGELQEQQEHLEAKVRRGEDGYRREKEALDAVTAAKAQQAAALERRLSAARNPGDAEARAVAARAAAAAARAERERAREAAAARARALQGAIHFALVQCCEVKDAATARLGGLRERVRAVAAEVAECGGLPALRAVAAEVGAVEAARGGGEVEV